MIIGSGVRAVVWLLSVLAALVSVPASQAASHSLILYDGKQDHSGEGYLSAQYISNLLGHFDGVVVEVRHISHYRNGDAARYDATFFASTVAKASLPPGFVEDVAASPNTFVWLGRHINELLAGRRTETYGFSYIDYRDDDGFDAVIYKNTRLPKGYHDLNLVAVLDSGRARVHAVAQNSEGAIYPYVVQSGKFWFFADSPFSHVYEGDRYLVFCDLLHDILGQAHAPSRRAMVRIEDLSVDHDPQELRAIADYLHSQRVPFQMAVIPIFRDPQRALEIYLSDRRPTIDALRYMVSRGGSIVMHGVTHQYRGTSGDDFEFWNDLADTPAPNHADRAALERKLDLAFRELFNNGLYPIAWETPHNAASANTYQMLKPYFGLFHERVLAAPALASEQYMPYPVRDRYGRFVVSENLGYVPVGKLDSKPIIEAARSMTVVRDGVATFYFHPFIKLDYLRQIVPAIRELGYDYVSLRQFASRVRFGQWEVAVAGTDGEAVPLPGSKVDTSYVRRAVVAMDGSTNEEVVPAQAALSPAFADRKFAPGTLVAWAPSAPPIHQQKQTIVSAAWKRMRDWLYGPVSPAISAARSSELPPVTLLWNPAARDGALREQKGYEAALGAYGYRVKREIFQPASAGPLSSPHDLLIVPAAIAPQLSPEQQHAVVTHLRAGGTLLVSGRSPLAERLGIEFSGRPIQVRQVSDLMFPERYLQWRPAEPVDRFELPEGAITLVLDPDTRQPLAFGARFEQGKYIYLATPLDSHSGLGLARYPYLAHHIQETFAVHPRLIRPRLEVYFDPGVETRQKADHVRLINSWRKAGIRIVHLAGWHYWGGWTFPYRDFIDKCHRYGIAVYAWFEPPMVTKKFWDDHPEWREKTAAGADGNVGWRYLMNLRNPQARAAALQFFHDVVTGHDWDGVNIAELNFDAGLPVMDPRKYVPMNADVRAEFRGRHGWDPAELFNRASPRYWERDPSGMNAFTDYRVEIITSLHHDFLREMEEIRKKRDLEIVVTMLDSLHSRTLREEIGVDSREIVKLMDRYRFTLQVEDPSEFWSRTPERYREFGRTYAGLVKDHSRLMFDVNVVERDVRGTSLPSALATGTEFARLLLAASTPTGRAAVYSEASVMSQDWELAAAVLASGSRLSRERGGWRIDSPFAVAVRVPTDHTRFYLDGRPWPVFESGSVLVPAGSHLLKFSRPFAWLLDFDQLDLRMRSISGELIAADVTSRGMTFEYDSPGRCIVVFNKQPHRIRVDGRNWTFPPLYARGEWSVVLPSGRHAVDVVANEPAVFAVELTSLFFSSFIVLFGFTTCGGMIALYGWIRLARAGRAVRRRFTRPRPVRAATSFLLLILLTCAAVAAAQETGPPRRVSTPGALLDDYEVVEPRSFTFTFGGGYVKVPFGHDVWLPSHDISVGLTPWLDISAYTSVTKVSFEQFRTTAVGDAYINAKFIVLKEAKGRPGVAFQPVLEVLGRPSLANNPLAPAKVNGAFGGMVGKNLWQSIRVYNHSGYFTRGIVFSSGAVEITRFSRFTPAVWAAFGAITRNREFTAEQGANATRLNVGGTLGFRIAKNWSAYVSGGRSLGRRDYNSTDFSIGGAVSYTWRPFARE